MSARRCLGILAAFPRGWSAYSMRISRSINDIELFSSYSFELR